MFGLHAGPLQQALSGAAPGFVAERLFQTSAWGISAGTRGGRLQRPCPELGSAFMPAAPLAQRSLDWLAEAHS